MHGVVGLIATIAAVVVVLRAWEAPRAVIVTCLCVGGLGVVLYAIEVTRPPGTPGDVARSSAEASSGIPPARQGTWIDAGPASAPSPGRARAADAAL